jgi:hypothetical protein
MANPRIFVNSIQIPVSPVSGYVLTSDAAGKATWQPVTASAATQRTFAFFAS